MIDLTSEVKEVEIPALRKKEEEERRGVGAPVGFLGRTTGVVLEAGPSIPGAGFNSLFWGINGRGGLVALGRAIFGRLFTPGELAFLAAGTLSLLALTVLGLSRYLNDGSDRATSRIAWEPQDPTNGFGVAGGLPREDMRPGVGDMVHLDTGEKASEAVKEAAAPVNEAPKAAAAEPQGEVKAESPEAPAVTPQIPVGRLVGGNFGGSSNPRFSAGGGLRDSLAPMNGPKTFGNLPAMKELTGQASSALTRARRLTNPRLTGQLGARSTRAMGQLKFTDRESRFALGASSNEPARQFATEAFEQKQTLGGASPIGGAGMSTGQAVPLGSGAPDMTAPGVGTGENKTPYQNKVDDAKKGIDMAMILTLLGLALLAAGAVALMISKMLMAQAAAAGVLPPAAAALKAKAAMAKMIGIALIIAGAAAIAAGLMMKKKAQDKAKDVAEESGQKDQGKVIHSCADQAVAPMSCNPPAVDQPGNSVHNDVVAESGSTYNLENGGPIQPGNH